MTRAKDLSPRHLSEAVKAYVEHSRRRVTILFTDIDDSTEFWEAVGDIRGFVVGFLKFRIRPV